MSQLILIVDDDAQIRKTLAAALLDEGFSVAFARNGAEALSRLGAEERIRPAAVILDVRMPVMNGIEFLSVRSNVADVEAVPVVVLTAATYRSDLFRPFKDCTLLRKPVRLDALLAALMPMVSDGPAN
jgi:CheY-like chemotaxis protein